MAQAASRSKVTWTIAVMSASPGSRFSSGAESDAAARIIARGSGGGVGRRAASLTSATGSYPQAQCPGVGDRPPVSVMGSLGAGLGPRWMAGG